MISEAIHFLRSKISAFILLYLLAACPVTVCQGQNLAFSHLSVENGLSQNSALCIAQDNRGFMWFGTRNGLNRYDGHQFKIYKNREGDSTSLPNNYIICLLNDSHGTLWAGTQNGLCKYNPEKDAFDRIDAGPQNRLFGITFIYETKKGNILVGTQNGPCEIERVAKKLSTSLYKSYVLSAYEDEEGDLWMGTFNGLVKRTVKKGMYEFKIYKHDKNDSGSISGDYILTINSDKLHHIWIGTSDAGLNMYDKFSDKFVHFSHKEGEPGIIHNSIRKIMPDSSGKLWIATQEGLSILDPVTQQVTSYQHDPENKKSLSQNSIHSIFADNHGITWIGTYFGGINILYPFNTAFTVYQNTKPNAGLSNDVVSSVLEDEKGNLWIGTEGGGLNYFNRQTNCFTSYQNKITDPQSLSSNLVKAVYRDKAGNIWIAAHGGGLNLFNPANGSFSHYQQKTNADSKTAIGSEIVTVLQDSYGRIWTGSSAGLSILSKTTTGFDAFILSAPSVYKLNNNNVKFLFEDSSKNLWVGTSNGLHVFDDGLKKMQVFLKNTKDSLSLQSDNINCIQQDSKGNIWIGTYYGGLSKYNLSKHSFITYTQKDGLPDDNVLGILEDDKGDLWISTGNGLSRFTVDKKIFKNYTYTDGLAGNEFNYNSFFKDSRGEMFFGGYNGLTSFFPRNIETNSYVAPVVFTSLRLFNQPVTINGEDGLLKKDIGLSKEIDFKYNQNIFSIEFALLNFEKSAKNRYAYKLEGFEQNWNYVNIPSATYTNLPSGNYTLLVKGANNDGVWSKESRIELNVLPPFWKTWWAYLIYIILFAAILFFVTRFFFLRELLKKEDELHQAKLNFFTNISHEIRTHLALISGPVERMMLGKKEADDDSRQLKYIKKNSDSLLQLVNELMDFRKAESGNLQLHVARGNLVAFVQDIYDSFQNLSASKNIATGFITPSQNIPLYFDKEQLEKVLFNLLSNAFKFTPNGGKIYLRIEENKSSVEIKVADNGKGIAPENLEKLFLNYYQENDYGKQNTGYGIGLALSKSIVELHKGTLIATSEIAAGGGENSTFFTISLLKEHAHFTAQQLMPVGSNGESYVPNYLPEEEETAIPVTQNEITAVTDKKYTVLVVEDNAEVRSFMRESLNSHYEVIESVNGVAGWECAVELIPDLIITDVMMPEMDGLTLCGKLKLDERTSHIPVIMLTAKTSTASQVSGLEMGADIYLTKPFSIQVLLLHVRNLLASRERMRQKYSAELILPKPVAIEPVETPEVIEPAVLSPVDEAFLQKLIQLVNEHLDDPELGVDMICKKVAMSRSVLYKKLKAVTDMSVNDFVKSLRLKKAAVLLQQDQLNINEVAYMVGFSDRKYFSKEFKKQFGVTPSEYEK